MEEVERSMPKLKLFGATIPIESTQIKKERDSKEDEEIKREKTDQDNKEGSNKVLPCPRCKSTDTKFCYFNNYNVNQPRHFCKGCQRYWTAGGTLRNVPFGAGRRKAKPAVSGGSSEEIGGSCLFHAADAREFGVEGMVVGQWANVSILSPPAKRRQTFLYGQTR